MGRRKGQHRGSEYCDDQWLIDRCLSCRYPPEMCLGEKKCLAAVRNEKKAQVDSILYAWDKGYRNVEIARMFGVTPEFVANLIFKEKYRKHERKKRNQMA